jgi:death on curing protein
MSQDRNEPVWLDASFALTVHDRQLAEHRGAAGLRDGGALESALDRPINRWAYGEGELVALAAAYAFGIARSHPFTDGNKRTAWVCARTFLVLNGQGLIFEKQSAIEMVLALAAGELTEQDVADWFRQHLV